MPKIKYDIFTKASEYTNLPHLKNVLIECGNGNYPSGMSVYSNTIWIKIDKKAISYEMTDDPKQMFILCQKIFDEDLKVQSTQELSLERKEFLEYENDFKRNEFEKFLPIRTLMEREFILTDYLLSLKKKYKMDMDEVIDLKNFIKCNISMGFLKSVPMKDGKIVKIENLGFKRRNGKVIGYLKNK